MFKFIALCFLAILALAAAKPSVIGAPLAYSTQLIASPYTAAYTTAYTSPYYASYASPYLAVASPYTASYSAYPAYNPYWLRR